METEEEVPTMLKTIFHSKRTTLGCRNRSTFYYIIKNWKKIDTNVKYNWSNFLNIAQISVSSHIFLTDNKLFLLPKGFFSCLPKFSTF